MTLALLAYLGGVLTILSPCILPVLPFVFARAGLSFWRGPAPMLAGMALAFAAVATLAAVGGGWAVAANQWGRWIALALLAAFGLMLLLPGLSDRLSRPVVALGNRLSTQAEAQPSIGGSVLLGIATGLLWAPCAGPILGLILTGAALNGASLGTTALLLAYALGAATALGVAAFAGGRLFATLKRSLGFGEGLRRVLGVAVLAGVAAIALGLDTGILTKLSTASTNRLEAGLIEKLGPQETASVVMPEAGGAMMMQGGPAMMAGGAAMTGPAMTGPGMTGNPALMMAADPAMVGTGAAALPIEGQMPPLEGAVQWLNSEPLTAEDLRGKVVLIDFWTYSCINCLRAIPYVKAWAETYGPQGLVVIGVHAPEFAFEKDPRNVTRAANDLGITYPVALDNDYAIWRAFQNRFWPAHYFVDAEGRIRHHHFGEGGYEESEQVIQQLLAEAGLSKVAPPPTEVTGSGVSAAANMAEVLSPETYLGHARAANNFNAEGLVAEEAHDYVAATDLRLNEWSFDGRWTVGEEAARLAGPEGAINFRFHARDVHLVLSPGVAAKPVPFTVTIDGQPPGADAGLDVDAEGRGTVTTDRLYQLYRAKGAVGEHLFEIRFDHPGVEAFAFTFG
ncbi:cytochrome c biogenesis protein CcdA [Rhodobacter sp. JA431]|uniref:cytochrome c biogenesis protein DipZ n=1 Tax=Rhodobacter sp. JA431 TaxID=570013 RepID=UPI000BD905FE|nr:cytochrome c biogenesis protein CcdA [Rhodobacter sp. JA431]SOC15968.1 cytochrome c biogenesis protein CcdA [Rhodobacter sp. JA431]